PWQIVRPGDSVRMINESAFVGEHTHLIQPGAAIHRLSSVKPNLNAYAERFVQTFLREWTMSADADGNVFDVLFHSP
ncbi:MAG: transposase, partial [Rhodospirillales bacterium]|nr:transposase [Rhodospirillales bacterium]